MFFGSWEGKWYFKMFSAARREMGFSFLIGNLRFKKITYRENLKLKDRILTIKRLVIISQVLAALCESAHKAYWKFSGFESLPLK